MLLWVSISGMNDNKLISNPIHAQIHELEDTEFKTPLVNVVNKRILVGLLGLREESVYFIYGV
jgi:hypothetical protein